MNLQNLCYYLNMDLMDLENFLKYYFDSCDVTDDGKVIHYRHRVDTIDGKLKIEVYSKDHNPPHFHVKYQNVDASFHLETCEFLVGKISTKYISKVKEWHMFHKKYLFEYWEKIQEGDKNNYGQANSKS